MLVIGYSLCQKIKASTIADLEEEYTAMSAASIQSLKEEMWKYSTEYFSTEEIEKKEGKWCREFLQYHRKTHVFTHSPTQEEEETSFDSRFLSAYKNYLEGEYFKVRRAVESLLKQASTEKPAYFGCKLHLLSLGASALFKMGSFYSAVWMASMGETLSKTAGFKQGREYFGEMLWIMDHTAGKHSTWHSTGHALISEEVSAQLRTPLCLEDKISRSAKYAAEPSLLRDIKIYDPREKAPSKTIREYVHTIKKIGLVCEYASPVTVNLINSFIVFGFVFYENEKVKIHTIRTNINAYDLMARLRAINIRNKDVLRRVCREEEEKRAWWRDRIALDREVQKEVAHLDVYVRQFLDRKRPLHTKIALIIEDILGVIPFEMCSTFKGHGVFRCSSMHHLFSFYMQRKTQEKTDSGCREEEEEEGVGVGDVKMGVDIDVGAGVDMSVDGKGKGKVDGMGVSVGVGVGDNEGVMVLPIPDSEFFYLLNPEKNLPNTEAKLLEFLNKEIPGARGITGRSPLPMEIEHSILNYKVFLYFGHGGGEKFFSPQTLEKAFAARERFGPSRPDPITDIDKAKHKTKTICLFGCSSAKVMALPNYNPHSTCISYMHHPLVQRVIGSLWDITDKDLDMITVGVLYSLKRNTPSLSVALNTLRHQCKLKYLNGGAMVLYGPDI
ncbi:hypothetical protein NECID01_1587 [Nematocida sp. AWRm77]|nr:hypothetical protein NECID01_1587 [Nematocida sp. AWRm77]